MISRFDTGPRMSQVVVHGNTVYLAGEVPDDSAKDVTGQTEEVLAKIDKLLKQAGSDKTKILSAQIFLPDMKDFAGMNVAWEKWVVPGQTPARATVDADTHSVVIEGLTNGQTLIIGRSSAHTIPASILFMQS